MIWHAHKGNRSQSTVALCEKMMRRQARTTRSRLLSGHKPLLTTVEQSGIYYTTRRTRPVFHKDRKWSRTFQNWESLQCTTVSYIILYINYTSIKFFEEKKENKTKDNPTTGVHHRLIQDKDTSLPTLCQSDSGQSSIASLVRFCQLKINIYGVFY